MRAFIILAACVVGAVVFGVAHDLVTANVCVEYFTVGHPKLIESNDPASLALAWGVVGTWWVGLLLGIALAIAASVGDRPRTPVRAVLRKVVALLVIMGVASSIAGVVGWVLARNGVFVLVDSLAQQV